MEQGLVTLPHRWEVGEANDLPASALQLEQG